MRGLFFPRRLPKHPCYNFRYMEKSKKLLVIMNSGIRKHGSFEDYMVQFALEARSRGWDLGFVFPAVGVPDVIDQLTRENAKTFVTEVPWNSKESSASLIRLIREFKPDVVDFHFCEAIAQLKVFLFCRLKSIPVIFHYHGEIRPIHTLRWKNSHLSKLRLGSRLWTRIITVSKANERFLRALNISVPIDVVYNGIDVPRFLDQSAKLGELLSPKQEGSPIQCLYMGSLIERKRVDILIRAFAIVKQACANARLTIVGEGKLESVVKDLSTELQLNDTVQFTGLLVDYPFDKLKQSDIFVSASESESFGLVFAEAMAFELPVVGCNVGGIPEVVADGETGILVEPNNPKALEDALLTIFQNHALRMQMGAAAVTRVT